MRDNLFHFLCSFIAFFCIISGTPVPTRVPTRTPTRIPTKTPTRRPTNVPTFGPTRRPTLMPTKKPTLLPTTSKPPIVYYSLSPTSPTSHPSARPKSRPTSRPTSSHRPIANPTSRPTARPASHVPHNFYPSPQPSSSHNSTVNSEGGDKNDVLSTEYVIIISLLCAIFALIVAFMSYVIYTRQNGVSNNYKTTVATTVEPVFDITTFSAIESAVVADIYDDEEKRYGLGIVSGNVEMRPLSSAGDNTEDLRRRISNI